MASLLILPFISCQSDLLRELHGEHVRNGSRGIVEYLEKNFQILIGILPDNAPVVAWSNQDNSSCGSEWLFSHSATGI